MAREASRGGGSAGQRRGDSPKDGASARGHEVEALREEVRGQLAALQEQVVERQQSFEESLRGWISAELAEGMKEVARTREDWEADKWQNQNFYEHLVHRLKAVESSLSASPSSESRVSRHPLAEMGRRLASYGDDSGASPSVRLLQENTRVVEARLSALEVSFSDLDSLSSTPKDLESLHSRVSRLEQCWAHRPSSPVTVRQSAGHRSEFACSTRSGGSHGSAVQASRPSGASVHSAASARSSAAERLCRVVSVEPEPRSARGGGDGKHPPPG